jgi:hypothetical protein
MIKYILIIIIIILIIIKIYNFYIINTNNNININQINKYIKTGDIILFKYNKINLIHEIVSPFSHVGIVVIINNKSYILETHEKGHTLYMGFNNDGVNLYNLYDRLYKYKGTTYLLKMKKPFSIENINNLINNIPNYLKIPYINNYKKYYFNNCIINKQNNYSYTGTNEGMICSEFIAYVLQDILNYKINYKCVSPVDFIYNDLYDKKLYKIIN